MTFAKKRLTWFGCLVAALAVAAVALTGCGSGPSAEELATKAVEAELSQIKQLDAAALDEMASAAGDEADDSFAMLGVDTREYLKSYLDGFDYKIGSVDVDERQGSAIVQVTVKCKSLEQILNDFADAFQAKIADLSQDQLTEDNLYKLGGEALTEVTEAAQPRDVELSLPVEKDSDGTWAVTADATDQIANMMFD